MALGIVFIVGVSFGMYLEGRQHHDELQSFASPKVKKEIKNVRREVWGLDLRG